MPSSRFRTIATPAPPPPSSSSPSSLPPPSPSYMSQEVSGRRRSYNLQEALRSTTESVLVSTTNADASPWHNIPLAFAVLPAIGGVLFNNGNYFVTDVILLFLVAVFLHWLVKFPWEWYNSSQAIACHRDAFQVLASDEDRPGVKKGSEQEERTRDEAAKELRANERLALLACFVGPCVGGWLLHAIRSQLSRPSEGLVSNLNLTIFVLAAELRPAAQVVKLLRCRSLYLHSVVHHPPVAKVDALASRVEELCDEVRDLTVVATRVVDREAQVDALTRAVRRYEKRETVRSAQTENRILEIDGRLNDVLTLAAAASARQSRTTFSMVLLEWICAAIVIPFSLTWKLVSLPAKAVETLAGFSGEKLMLKGARRQQGRLKGRVQKGVKGKGVG